MRFLLFLLPLLLLLLSAAAAASRNHRPQPVPTASAHLARSCSHATYPTLCIRTLSTYGGAAETPRDLAQAAVAVTLTRARRISDFLAGISDQGSKSQRTAVGDCVDQISDSVDELSRTLGELKHLRPATFEFQMSNAQTWVSAALTYDDTCLDGLEGVQAEVKADVKRRITNVAKVTSNALYMIHRLDESRRSNP